MNEGKTTKKTNAVIDSALVTEEVLYIYKDEDDKESGIETGTYPNGNMVKRFKISGDRIVVVRELKGFDMMRIDDVVSKSKEEYMPVFFHFAVKIDGLQVPIEDFANFKGKDFNKIKIQVLSLNF